MRLRGLAARTPLRIKLILAMLVLVALGLAASGVAGAVALRGYLLNRVDDQLTNTAHMAVERQRDNDQPAPSGDADGEGSGRQPALSTAFFTQYSDASGQGTGELRVPTGSDQSAPVLPALDQASVAELADTPFTASSTGAGHDWRLLVTSLPSGGSVVVGVNLSDVDGTVGQLIVIELVVGVIVLVAMAGVSYTVIRTSLRPLDRVEVTAAAIAGGDLSRRVPDAPERTEVGQLAKSLNGMLTQIEAAFAAREASESAARTSEARMRRFIADASHELRTPLTSVRGFAELLRHQRGASAETVTSAAARIEKAAARMGLLVDDLLMLARIDQQRPLQMAPVDLLGLAADAVAEARAAAPDHPITLRAIDAEGAQPPVVAGDEARLRQVVGNLLQNAVRHTPAGTAVTVTVGTTAGDDGVGTTAEDGGGAALLTVADTGPGLPAEEADRIFERFYRVDESRDRASGGTGLGLSIVAGLVAAHGGTVTVETAPGAGARFTVRLPLLSVDEPDDDRTPELAGGSQPDRWDGDRLGAGQPSSTGQ